MEYKQKQQQNSNFILYPSKDFLVRCSVLITTPVSPPASSESPPSIILLPPIDLCIPH